MKSLSQHLMESFEMNEAKDYKITASMIDALRSDTRKISLNEKIDFYSKNVGIEFSEDEIESLIKQFNAMTNESVVEVTESSDEMSIDGFDDAKLDKLKSVLADNSIEYAINAETKTIDFDLTALDEEKSKEVLALFENVNDADNSDAIDDEPTDDFVE